jgi:hypothetical protein
VYHYHFWLLQEIDPQIIFASSCFFLFTAKKRVENQVSPFLKFAKKEKLKPKKTENEAIFFDCQ